MPKRQIRARGVALTLPRNRATTLIGAIFLTAIATAVPSSAGDSAPIVPGTHPYRAADLATRAVPWLADIEAAGRKFGALVTESAQHNMVLDSAAAARRKFEAAGFHLSPAIEGRAEVPRLFAASLPCDFHQPLDANERKELFVRILLPLVLRANEEILAERARLIEHIDTLAYFGATSQPAVEPEWLSDLRARYEAEDQNLDALLTRVDMVPPSLALAQGAQESGWGRSRFAITGNALFGQWSFVPNTGMTPKRRDEGRTHSIKRFDTAFDAVKGYMKNLNTHPTYAGFRRERAVARRSGHRLDGFRLAANLDGYAEDTSYVQQLRAIMRTNGLDRLDRLRLHRHPAPVLVEFSF